MKWQKKAPRGQCVTVATSDNRRRPVSVCAQCHRVSRPCNKLSCLHKTRRHHCSLLTVFAEAQCLMRRWDGSRLSSAPRRWTLQCASQALCRDTPIAQRAQRGGRRSLSQRRRNDGSPLLALIPPTNRRVWGAIWGITHQTAAIASQPPVAVWGLNLEGVCHHFNLSFRHGWAKMLSLTRS